MKLSLEYLAQHTASSLHTAYWISGNEPVLRDEALATIRAAAVDQGFSGSKKHFIERGFHWDSLNAAFDNYGLFIQKELIEIHLFDHKMPDSVLQQLLNKLKEKAHCVLIISEKLDKKYTQSKAFKAFQTEQVWIALWPLFSHKVPGWLNRIAQRRGLNLSQDMLSQLTHLTEGNLLSARQTIEQLALLDKDQINLDMLTVLAQPKSDNNIFQLIDLCLSAQTIPASRLLKQLSVAGTAAIHVVWAFERELLRLMTLSSIKNISEKVWNQQNIWPARRTLYAQALNRQLPLNSLLRRCRSKLFYTLDSKRVKSAWIELSEMTRIFCGHTPIIPEQTAHSKALSYQSTLAHQSDGAC